MLTVRVIKNENVPAVWKPDTLYFIENNTYAETYITDKSGVPKLVGNSQMILGYISNQTPPPYVVTETDVTQYQGALSINESQITGLNYFTPSDLLTDYGFTDNSANWNTAFGWGDHASAGYLTSFSETDPVFQASDVFGVTSTDISNWNTAFGWGDHASAGYLTSFSETDPVFQASDVFGVTSTDISNWNTAFGWGDHSLVGYLTDAPSDGSEYVRLNGAWSIASGGGGGGTPAGANTEVQFNNAGAFGASSDLTFNSTTKVLAATKTDSTLINLDNGLTYIQSPRGGQRGYSTSNQTGYLIIKLPLDISSGDNGYFRMRFTLHSVSQLAYATNFKSDISFTWSLSNVNIDATAVQVGGNNLPTRFSNDSDSIYVYIGESDTLWFRPNFKITDVQVDWAVEDVDIWREGWDISVSSTLPAGLGTVRTIQGSSILNGVRESYPTSTLTTNGWHTILEGESSTNNSVYGQVIIRRLGTGVMKFTFDWGRYGDYLLRVDSVSQLSSNYFQGVRLVRESGFDKVQVKCGSVANSMIWDIYQFNPITRLVSETATGTETVGTTIEFIGEEIGMITANDFKVQGNTITETLNISNIPTSSAGLSSGDVWNDSGTLKIVT